MLAEPPAKPKRLSKGALRRLVKSYGPIPGYDPVATAEPGDWFDQSVAEKVIQFFETCLTHHKSEFAGQPFVLELWEKAIVVNLLAWKRADGTRRYRQAYIEIPKKNGKSQITAGLGLYMLFCDGEPGAEIYCCAGERSQAAIVLDAAKAMVKAEPEMSQRAQVVRNCITVAATSSKMEVLSSEADTKHGRNTSCLIYDELFIAPNSQLFDALTTGQAGRRQPLVITITTAGNDRTSLCWELHQYAENVASGKFKDRSFLPVIYAAPVEADWTDPKVWAKANPNLGVSVKLEFLTAACKRAIETPRYESPFRQFHLNQWVSVASRWIQEAKWGRCRSDQITEDAFEGAQAWGGLDLSTTTDLTAFDLIFKLDGDWCVLPYVFCPENRIAERAKNDRVPYDVWAREGFLIPTPGDVVDYDFVFTKISMLARKFQIQAIGFDPWNAMGIATRLQGEGVKVIEVRQGYATLSEPSKVFEALVAADQIRHPGNPVLDWCVSNLCIDMDPAGNIKPSKSKSKERIDAATALITALATATSGNGQVGPSVYEGRGLLCLG